ncbi:hypothetical protein GCM10009609_33580 [Pseudonocardia aurantiaca]|uniref:Ferredoxin n=1 Tax=Pseudonocardia aurantiaca TaxID=75290 RepID=A0ABW4FS34_9PSEU
MFAPDDVPLHPVSCGSCGTCVFVRKNSLAHTLVQWTSDTARCVELSGAVAGAVPTCTRLRDSIESSVRRGTVPVPDL